MSLVKKLRNTFIGMGLVSSLFSLSPKSYSTPISLDLNDIKISKEYKSTPKKSTYRINPSTNLEEFFSEVRDATVYLEAGQYNSRGADLMNINLRASNPIDFIHDEMAISSDYRNVTGAYSLIKGNLVLDGTSSIEGVMIENNESYGIIIRGSNNISNTYVSGWGGIVLVPYSKNSLIESSAITNNFIGLFMQQVENKGLAKIRDSIIKGNEIGFISLGHLDLGNEFDKGNNILANKINIKNIEGRILPAKWNWWYKPIQSTINATGTTQTTYKLLTTEEEILTTIINRNPNEKNTQTNNQNTSNSSVDVVPFYDYDYFNPPTPTPTITPTKTQTPTETNTLIPTPTETQEPNPTNTIQPTYTPYPTPTEKWNNADLNDDGFVDNQDLYLFIKEWKKQSPNLLKGGKI